MIDGSQPGRAGNSRYFSRRIKDTQERAIEPRTLDPTWRARPCRAAPLHE
jgi:hypothetical protein